MKRTQQSIEDRQVAMRNRDTRAQPVTSAARHAAQPQSSAAAPPIEQQGNQVRRVEPMPPDTGAADVSEATSSEPTTQSVKESKKKDAAEQKIAAKHKSVVPPLE